MMDQTARGTCRAPDIAQRPEIAASAWGRHAEGCTTWGVAHPPRLTHAHLAGLLGDELAAVVISGVVSEGEQSRLLAALRLAPWKYEEGHGRPAGTLGTALTDHAGDRQLGYFGRVPRSAATHWAVSKMAGVDLSARMMRVLGDAWLRSVRVAEDPDYGSYAAGVFRTNGAAPLHSHYAPADAADWSIACVTGQLRCEVCLAAAADGAGGETAVYRQPWSEEIERFRRAGSPGYSAAAVAGAAGVKVRPSAGDLLIFNSRNLHELLPARGAPVTYGTFAGVTPKYRELVLYA